MELSDDVRSDANSKVMFTIPNGDEVITQEILVSDITSDSSNNVGGNCWIFPCHTAAKEMTAPITVKTVYTNDDGEQQGEEFTYSVKRYADYILDEQNNFDDAAKDLVRSMLYYGGCAQTLFDYRTNELASADLEGYTPLNAPAAFAECGLANVNYRATQDAGLQLTYVSLVLESKTTLRLYFKRTEATASDPLPTLTDGTSVYEPHQKDGETTDGEYYYDITDFAPGEIFSMRSVSFDGGEQFNVCVGDYCNWAIASNDTNLADTVTALYSYDEYGKAYKTLGYTPGEG